MIAHDIALALALVASSVALARYHWRRGRRRKAMRALAVIRGE